MQMQIHLLQYFKIQIQTLKNSILIQLNTNTHVFDPKSALNGVNICFMFGKPKVMYVRTTAKCGTSVTYVPEFEPFM